MTSPLRMRPGKGRKGELIPVKGEEKNKKKKKRGEVHPTVITSLSLKLECLLWLPSLLSCSDKKRKIHSNMGEIYYVLQKSCPLDKRVVVFTVSQRKLPQYSLWTTFIFTWSSQLIFSWRSEPSFKTVICTLETQLFDLCTAFQSTDS